MAYIGKTPVIGNFVKLDSITVVNGQAAYTMQNGGVNFTSYDNVNQFLVSLNGVLQAPTDSFTVSGSTLTFASNLSTGDVIDFVLVLGNSLDIGTPSDNTVTAAKLNNDIISGQTELASEPADTDEFLVSDAGTLKRIDYSLIKASPAIELLATATASNSSSVSFDGYFSSTYKNYEIRFSDVYAQTNGDKLRMRVRQSNADVTSSDYGFAYEGVFRQTSISDGHTIGGGNNTYGEIDYANGKSNDSDRISNGIFHIYNPLSTAKRAFRADVVSFLDTTTYQIQTSNLIVFTGNNSVLSGISFFFSSGNIAGGTFKLYGVK